ncbi:hypothetical protein BSLG_009443 [Batrachochytrium salamandrivorans]|nr:hypothetical protein BSLG_009443 [Batrachochytrium salamandrivorans]
MTDPKSCKSTQFGFLALPSHLSLNTRPHSDRGDLMLLTIIVLLALPVLGWFIIIAIGSWPENIGLPNPNSPLNGRKQAVLLVIAHPDDECMFFAPTLLALAATTDRYVLCLSVGNAQGLGRIREKELRASCRILGHSNEIHVESMDHELLPDSMTQDWDLSLIIDTVASHIHKHNIDSGNLQSDEAGKTNRKDYNSDLCTGECIRAT